MFEIDNVYVFEIILGAFYLVFHGFMFCIFHATDLEISIKVITDCHGFLCLVSIESQRISLMQLQWVPKPNQWDLD